MSCLSKGGREGLHTHDIIAAGSDRVEYFLPGYYFFLFIVDTNTVESYNVDTPVVRRPSLHLCYFFRVLCVFRFIAERPGQIGRDVLL